MKFIVSFALTIFSLIYADNANALIFLPAVILIPIAKIVAIIIAAFSAPAALTGTIIGKTTHKSIKKLVVFSILVVICVALLIGIFLKIVTPERPFF